MEFSVATRITLAARNATETESARFMGQRQGFAKAADKGRFPAPAPAAVTGPARPEYDLLQTSQQAG